MPAARPADERKQRAVATYPSTKGCYETPRDCCSAVYSMCMSKLRLEGGVDPPPFKGALASYGTLEKSSYGRERASYFHLWGVSQYRP